MMLLSEFAVFAQVVESGSFTRAAGALGLSKAAVSDHVSRLEDHLGVQLLRRTTRSLSLTESGEACYRHARRMRDEAESAAQAATERHTEPLGLLRVASPDTFTAMHLAPLAARFLADYPRLQIEFSEGPLHINLIGERFDLAVRIGDLPDSGLVARRLALSRTRLVAAPDYVAAKGGLATLADLAGCDALHVLPLQPGDAWQLVDSRGARKSVTVPVRLTSDSGAATCAAARAGAGLALLPDWLVAPDLMSGALVNVLPDWGGPTVPVQALYPGHTRISAKGRAFVDALADAFAGGLTG
tara:strand:+ start:676 stop:1575 length:900 start_codon:yes stop_codon:yes gene_type:complete